MSRRDIYYIEDDEWLPIWGFPGYYVSVTGRVMGPGRHGSLQLLHPTVGRNGHLYVSLYRNGERYKVYVHRLVAEHFIPNPKHYPVVRHIDDCPSYNDVSNLAWGTQGDNVLDMRRNGNDYVWTDEDREKAYRKRRTPIKAINLETGVELYFKSQQEASRALGIDQGTISMIVNKKPGRHSEHGYTFELVVNVE